MENKSKNKDFNKSIMLLILNIKHYWVLYLLLAVPLAYIIIFRYVPMYGLVLAFREYDPRVGIFGGEWVGFANFNRFFRTYDFFNIIFNTISISVYSIIAGFFAPILLAIAINETRSIAFKKTIQMATYAPYFISTVVLVGIMFQVFSTHIGIVNKAVKFLFGEPINFMGYPPYFKHMYVWSGIWQGTGYGSVIYIAALTGVDPQLYEAITVDGASRMQKIRYIDIPAIIPTAVVLLILNSGNIMNVGFEKIYLMQNAMNRSVSEVISTYVYKMGMVNMNFGFSTTVSLFNSVINLILIVSVNFISSKLGENSLW